MSGLTPSIVAMIRGALDEAPHGQRTMLADQLAATYGVSRSAVYRAAARGGASRRRAATRPEYRAWVPIAVAAAHRAPEHPIPLDVAIDACVAAGDLPPEATEMPLATAYRLRREMGLAGGPRRHARMHADWPMQAVQVDGSTSHHLRVVRALPDGDWLLQLYRRPWSAAGYKNRPLGPHRERVLVYGAWDMCTGLTVARYCVSRGEDAIGMLSFLCWALGAEHGHPGIPLHGVPDEVWSDLGPFARSRPARDLLERLGVPVRKGRPYQKSRMGGIERQWRSMWTRFERSLFLRQDAEIRLSELNGRLIEYIAREAGRRVSRTPLADGRRASRAAAWTALTATARPADRPLHRLPLDPLRTLAREDRRRIDAGGHIHWEGREFEVAGWCDRWVRVYQSMSDPDRLVAVEIRTDGRPVERRIAAPVERRRYGEIRTAPATPLDRLLAETADAPPGTADVYAPRDGGGSNVTPMRARTAPPAPLADPLDTDHHPDLEAAMAHFHEIYPWPLTPQSRASVAEHLTAASYARSAVTELAARLLDLPTTTGGSA